MYKIVVADDNKIIQRNLCNLIKSYDGKVEVVRTFSNGKKVLDYLEKNTIDILVTDIKMPVMDGLELVKTMDSQYPLIKSIIVSGYDDFQYAKQAMRLRVNEYILKPVDQNEFHESLDRVIREVEKVRMSTKPLMKKNDLVKIIAIDEEMLLMTSEELRRINMIFSPIIAKRDKILFLDTVMASIMTWHRNAFTKHSIREFLLHINGLLNNMNQQVENFSSVMVVDNMLFMSETFEDLQKTSYEIYDYLFEKMILSKKISTKELYLSIEKYLRDNTYNLLNMQKISDAFHVSPSYINRVFKQYNSSTPMNYLTRLKIDEAKKLLSNQDGILIKDVADILSFGDQHHFSKVFKSLEGMSPLEYRNHCI